MNLQQEKLEWIDSHSQLIQTDMDGTIIDSTNELVSFKQGINLFEEVIFLSTMLDTVQSIPLKEQLRLACLQSDYFGIGKYFDFTFYKKRDNGQEYLLILVEDFTKQYTKVLELQQDRNLEVIARENAEIEALKEKEGAANIFIKVDNLLISVDQTDIEYIEAFGDYIKLHTSDKMYISHATLKNIAEMLPEQDFVKIHRSFIVRLEKIKSLTLQKVQVKDTFLPVSQGFRDELFNRIRKLN